MQASMNHNWTISLKIILKNKQKKKAEKDKLTDKKSYSQKDMV